jgi:phosphoglycolate phosphatase-like HAD superfamily hydrolase
LERYLDITGIAGLVDGVACGNDVKVGKPSPDLVSLALKRVRAGRAQAVLVGDTPYDSEAARAAGIRPIGVLTGHFSERTLREAGCEAVFADVLRFADALRST